MLKKKPIVPIIILKIQNIILILYIMCNLHLGIYVYVIIENCCKDLYLTLNAIQFALNYTDQHNL